MKTLNLKRIVLGLLTLSISIVKSQDIAIFELNSTALFNDKPTNNYSILVYENGKLIDSIFMKRSRPANIRLEGEKLYSVVFKKAECMPQLVIVDTKIPKGIGRIIEEPFNLQIELSSEVNKNKIEYEDYPAAVLRINRKTRILMASENYYQLTRN